MERSKKLSKKQKMFLHVANVILVAMIIECFLCAILLVRSYAKDDCFERIETTTTRTVQVLNHSMDNKAKRLTLLADILAANQSNSDELLQTYMENFCKAQEFTATCIHRADGTYVTYGYHSHNHGNQFDFASEVNKVPYVSEVYSFGEQPSQKYFYIAVPVVRDGEPAAVLYGNMSMEILPDLIASDTYNGVGEFYIVDGSTGEFLLDMKHDTLKNLYTIGEYETKPDYDINTMKDDIRNGKSGQFVFKSQDTDKWRYMYYMPTGINNWSIQMTIDEDVAFGNFNDMNRVLFILFILVVTMMFLHVSVLMVQTSHMRKKDQNNLKKFEYMYKVQQALLTAHNNPEHVEQSLKAVADEITAETVMLLSFDERIITQVYYWPSADKPAAKDLLGRSIRDDFPVIFDQLSAGNSVLYYEDMPSLQMSETGKAIFEHLEVANIMMVPILDTAKQLKGAICAVNMEERHNDCELLECVTYDFFMALANIENHNIIKQMGSMDYLTNIKNRNSFEAEAGEIAAADAKNLWCMFLDANGLHEINNTQGHKAGDLMLCAVADAVKKAFGVQYSYRLGGDEFVAFDFDSTHDELLKKKKTIMAELAVKGYYVSVGFEGITKNEDDIFDIELLAAEAEAIMYREKREYYQKNKISSDRGHFPKTE